MDVPIKNKLTVRGVYSLLAALIVSLALPGCEQRTWQPASGAPIRGTLVQEGDTAVRILIDQEKIVEIPLDQLGADDLKYLAELEKTRPAGMQSVIMVEFVRGKETVLAPGYVCQHAGDLAYVVVPSGGTNHLLQPYYRPEEESFAIVWNRPSRRVAAKRTAYFGDKGQIVLTAPAKEMPPPIVVAPAGSVRNGTSVHIVGFKITNAAFSRIAGEGSTYGFEEQNNRQLAKFRIMHRLTLNSRGAIVFNRHNQALGWIYKGETPALTAQGDAEAICRFNFLEDIDRVQFLPVRFAPKSGDHQKIEFQFVADIIDPFRRVRSPKLRIRRKYIPKELGASLSPPSAGAGEPLADATEIELKRGMPDEIVRKQIATQWSVVPENILVGNLTFPNDGEVRNIFMEVQVVHTGEDGKAIYLKSENVIYNKTQLWYEERGRKQKLIPDIPAINGKPLGMPTIVKHPQGGLQLTSSVTRSHIQAIAPHSAPQPAQIQAAWHGQTESQGSLIGKMCGQGVRAVAFSGDGKNLYVVDHSALRKLRLPDLLEESRLSGAEFEGIAFSEGGLVVSLKEAKRIWILDAKTLAVLREFPIGANLLAANPTTPTVIVGSGMRLGPGVFFVSEMAVLDVRQGRVLHVLKSGYGTGDNARELIVDGVVPASELFSTEIKMSSDGRNFYTAYDRIRKFRIEGSDIIFEGQSPQLAISRETKHIALSPDGKWVGLTAYSGSKNPQHVQIFDTSNISATHRNLYTGIHGYLLGFDPKSGNICVADTSSIYMFNAHNKRVGNWAYRTGHVDQLEVHPHGGELALVQAGRLTYLTVPDAKK